MAEKDSARNVPLLPPAAAWADPMASVSPLQTTQGVRNQPPLPPVDRDPMAPVDDLLPPAALTDSPSRDAGANSVSQSDAVPVNVAKTTARLITQAEAARRRRAQQRLVAVLGLLFVLLVAGLSIGYVSGFIRIGPVEEVSQSGDSGGSTLQNGNGNWPGPGELDIKSGDSPGKRGGHTTLPKGTNGVSGEGKSGRPLGSSTPPERGTRSNPPDQPTKNSEKPAPNTLPAPPPDPAQVARFQELLAAARQSLGQKNIAEARKKIAEAKGLAASEEQKLVVTGFESLGTFVEGFWEAVREGKKGLSDAGELQVGNTVVSIVEVGDDHLTIRAAGENRRYASDQLPAGLAMAIAKRWFDERPDNKVFLGAFLFVDPRTDVADAKRMWEEAASAGIDVKHLLALLPFAAK
jgi:hypothetical protein